MTGFLDAPPLHRLVEYAGGPLRVAADTFTETERGPLPLHAFLSTSFDQHVPTSGALRGVPIAVKDCIATRELPTTCGSRVLEGYRSPYDATVVRRLREAGAVIVGKTNLDEFAMGASTELSAFGPTRNPRDRRFVPGGSSGGSAAAVAAGITPVALGSETRWSIRQPAAFCGIVGFVPTYGRISRYGLIGFAPSVDRVGIFGRSVADAASVYDVIAGFDPRDGTSARHDVHPASTGDVDEASRAGLRGLRFGIPIELLDTVTRSVRDAFDDAIRLLRRLGAEILEVRLPHTHLAIPAYQVITSVEASSSLARFDGVRFGRQRGSADAGAAVSATRAEFGPEVKRRMIFGAELLSGARPMLTRARAARRLVAADYAVALSSVDLLFAPSAPEAAFGMGERVDDPHPPHLTDILTVGSSLAGLPAISIPIGADDALPVGGQFIAAPFRERPLLRAAAWMEAAMGGRGVIRERPREVSRDDGAS